VELVPSRRRTLDPCGGPSIPDGRDDCGRRHRSDASDGHQPLAGFVFASSLLDQRIGFVDPHTQMVELQLQLSQEHAQCSR
jgi:hypothetical protein